MDATFTLLRKKKRGELGTQHTAMEGKGRMGESYATSYEDTVLTDEKVIKREKHNFSSSSGGTQTGRMQVTRRNKRVFLEAN